MAAKLRCGGWRSALVMVCVLATAVGCRRDDDPTGPGKRKPGDFPIVSAFNRDLEGWTAYGDAKLNWESALGNPGGYARGIDQTLDDTWYFQAPSAFLGDVSGAYGRILAFDLYWTETKKGNPNNMTDDVLLVGATLTLVHTYPTPPGTTWTTFKLRLDEAGAWANKSTGQPATRAEIESVLRDLRAIRIRGEFTDNAELAGLDNVQLGAAS